MTDPGTVVPLSGRRGAARVLVASVVVCVIAGIVGVGVEGRTSSWAALLSLVAPGSGQVVQGHTVVGAVMLVLWIVFLVELIVFYGLRLKLGVLPVLALTGASALHAAMDAAWWAVPIGAVAAIVVAGAASALNGMIRRRRLALVQAARSDSPTVGITGGASRAAVATLDRYGESFLRYFLAFGHAPVDDWSIFDDPHHLDAALRYQMVVAGWALYLSQHLVTPAYRQGASTALGSFAERCRDHRVWGYTHRQNLLKALRNDGDPFGYENVMYSGYVADVVSMYEATSGDRRYDEPGGYSVNDGRRCYEWSHDEILENLALQHAQSPYGAIGCEPGWIWPPCQTFSLRAIQLGDLVHGVDHSWAHRRYADSFRRYFVRRNGEINTCRSSAGFNHPAYDRLIGISGQAGTGAMMAPLGHELVESHYERSVRSRMHEVDGRIELTLSKLDSFDSSYGWNPAFPYSLALLYASEMDDNESAAGLRATLEEMLTPGEDRPGPGSILSMGFTFLALVNTGRGLASAHAHVPAHDTTPELEHAPFPQVVVTAAHTDGSGVRATVAPGPASGSEVEIRFARLDPGATYRLTDSGAPRMLDADRAGRVRAFLDSSARHDLVLERC